MRKRKRVFAFYRYTECDSMAAYLEGMARKGWHFSGWRLGMIFEKGEPENTEYAVEVFPKGSEDDRRPEADAEEYGEYCEAAGWKLVDSRKKFCVFRKIREDAVPIVTEEERIENVCKAEFRYRLKRLPCLLFGTWMSWMNFLTGRAENWLFSNLMMTTFLLLNLLVVMEVGKLAGLAVWSFQKKRKWKAGIVPFFGSRNRIVCCWQRLRVIAYGIPLAMITVVFGITGEYGFMAALLGMIFLLFALEAGIEFLRPEREIRWLLELVVSFVILFGFVIAWIALVVAETESEEQQNRTISVDMGQSEEADLAVESFEEQESIFGTRQYIRGDYTVDTEQGRQTGEITVFVYESPYPWIPQFLWGEQTDGASGSEEQAEELEALRVQTEQRDGWRRDVVLYQEQLLVVEDSDSLAEPYGLRIFENYLDH